MSRNIPSQFATFQILTKLEDGRLRLRGPIRVLSESKNTVTERDSRVVRPLRVQASRPYATEQLFSILLSWEQMNSGYFHRAGEERRR